MRNILAAFSQKDIASCTGYDFILQGLCVVQLEEIGIMALIYTAYQHRLSTF
ncbi:MAG: hypothetical protein AB4080_01435 [Trichodesmium sp.]